MSSCQNIVIVTMVTMMIVEACGSACMSRKNVVARSIGELVVGVDDGGGALILLFCKVLNANQ